MHKYPAWLVGSLVLFGAACSTEKTASGSPDGGAQSASDITFHRDVRPLLEKHCVGCHTEGGIGPFVIGFDPSEWKDGAPAWVKQAVSAVESRVMPPWMPDPSCHDIAYSRALSDDEIAVFKAFRDAGYRQGDPAQYQKPDLTPAIQMGDPTLELASSEAYVPNAALSDDYRCFLLPHTFDVESYMVATDIAPEQRDQVHHVILYAVDGASVARAEKLDAEEPGVGYTCFGSSGIDGAQNVGGWVPGAVPMVTPPNSARVLNAGSRLVMQIHYNNSHVAAGQSPKADQTKAKLWLMAAGEKPEYRITTVPLVNVDIEIPAGDANSVHTRTYSVPLEGTLVGVTPHMHTLGKTIEVKLQKQGQEQCLVRIPAWDFHWQQLYLYPEDSYVELGRGDELTLTCAYDNSAGDQTVTWGERTTDEMCLNYLLVRTPFAKSRSVECPSYDGCLDACAQGDSLCIAKCGAVTDACSACVTPALARCAMGRCQVEGLGLQACQRDCKKDNSCTPATCVNQLKTFFSCMEPALRDGSCDSALDSCGT